jgi:hypothetical protein
VLTPTFFGCGGDLRALLRGAIACNLAALVFLFCAACSLSGVFVSLEKVMMANPKEVDYNKIRLN